MQRTVCAALGLLALPGLVSAQAAGQPVPQSEARHFSSLDGLPSDGVLSLTQGRDGYLWVGTDRGLARFDGRHWRLFDRSTHPTLASDEITSLEPDRYGYLWVGTKGGGLYRFDGQSFLPVSRPNQLGGPWNVTALLQQEDGLLWVGTPGDLLYLPPIANSLRYGLPGIPVTDLTIDPYGHVWASAGRGLFRQVQLTFQTLSLPLGTENRDVHAIVMTADGVLVIGREDGLMVARGRFENSGLPQETRMIEALDRPVRDLRVDAEGRLVAGTDAAVLSVDIESGTLETLLDLDAGEESGGAGEHVMHQLFEDHQGSLWVATSRGLYQLPAARPAGEPTLRVAVEAPGVTDRYSDHYVLPPETEGLAIDIAAPTFLAPERLRVRARLEGHEEAWRQVAGRLEYPELPAGTYRLVSEASLDGETWPIRRVVEIEIEPHLHRTAAFWIYLVGGIGLVLAIVVGWIAYGRRRERLFMEMAAQEWREIQEESGMIDFENDPDWRDGPKG